MATNPVVTYRQGGEKTDQQRPFSKPEPNMGIKPNQAPDQRVDRGEQDHPAMVARVVALAHLSVEDGLFQVFEKIVFFVFERIDVGRCRRHSHR